jgi:glycosyltransferase involved in cell wall biosynthesis
MGRMLISTLSTLSPWRQAHTLLSLTVLLLWSVSVSLLIRGRRFYRSLSEIPFTPDEMEPMPRLSILVPACNEGDTVERAMRSLLAIDYPDLEIIAINDRSTDDTGAILDRLAATDSRLRVLHITDLPHGWLGKNHAMQVAGEEATGKWLLFTDADVVFAPDTLRRAMAYVCTRDIDHLVLSPRCETHDFWERLFVSYFGLMFSFRTRPWEVANPKSEAYVGLGAFNMVRATAYRQFGGHRALPMEVLDDSKLGKVVKRAGFRQELLDGGDLVSVRWVVGLHGVINGMTKNAFAGFEFKLLYEFGAILLLAYTALYPVAGLFLPGWPTRLMALVTLVVMVIAAGVMRRITEANRWYGLGYPLAALILIYIILRSTWRTYRQQGIIWRGTLYPLDELRKGVV